MRNDFITMTLNGAQLLSAGIQIKFWLGILVVE